MEGGEALKDDWCMNGQTKKTFQLCVISIIMMYDNTCGGVLKLGPISDGYQEWQV